MAGDTPSKKDALFERFAAYNDNILNQIHHVHCNFCFDKAAPLLSQLGTEGNLTRQEILTSLYYVSMNAFLKEYLNKSDKIEAFKSTFSEQNGSYLSQRHFDNMWQFRKCFNIFKDLNNSKQKELFNKNFAESYLILIDKLINAMVNAHDLDDLIHQDDCVRRILTQYPDLQNNLPKIASTKEWGKDPQFNFNKIRHGAKIELNIINILDSVKDGIIHYSYLEPKELDKFHNKLRIKHKKLPNNFDFSSLKYEHNGITLSLGEFRFLYGQAYLGEHKESRLKAFNELINIHKKLEFKTFLQYTDQQPVNTLLCHAIGIESYFTIRECILEKYSEQPNFHAIHKQFAGRHYNFDQLSTDIFFAGTQNGMNLSQCNPIQSPAHVVPERKSSEVVPSPLPEEPAPSAPCDEPKTKNPHITASSMEAIVARVNFENFFQKEQEPSWGEWVEEFQGNLDGFKKLLINEWKNSARAAFDIMNGQALAKPTLLLVVKEITSLLGFKDHPYLDNNKSRSPMLKIYLKTWRDESLSAFMKGIVHLDKKSQKKAKAEFIEIARLYNALLSNIKDYQVYHKTLKIDKVKKIDGKYTYNELMNSNKNFFHRTQVFSMEKMGPFYPLNQDLLIDHIDKNSSNADENSLYLKKLSFTAPEILSYLEEVKTELNTLNDTYWKAQIHVHSQDNEAIALNELLPLMVESQE